MGKENKGYYLPLPGQKSAEDFPRTKGAEDKEAQRTQRKTKIYVKRRKAKGKSLVSHKATKNARKKASAEESRKLRKKTYRIN